jgi:hypothetical protein
MILLEAPGVKTNSDVVDERICAGKIEVDQAGKLVAEKEHVVWKQVGVNHALRQSLRPVLFEHIEFGGERGFEAALYLVGAITARRV